MSTNQSDASMPVKDWPLPVRLLLNAGHAIDHMYLLVFAAAVAVIAIDFGFTRWEDLMPFGVGAFILFGLGALPAGRLGDLWGRRKMMLVFFFGMSGSMLLAAMAQSAWQLAAALTIMGAFASIYHPVGIPMLVQRSPRPGLAIGINGLAGNLGVAVAALITGFLVKWFDWRAAFIVPALIALGCGLLFMQYCPHEESAPVKGTIKAKVQLPPKLLMRALLVLTMASVSANMLFNFTTNGNGQLMVERFKGVIEDPALLGLLLAVVYGIGALAQVVVGRLLDRVAVKPLFLTIVVLQIPLLLLASVSHGWMLYAALIGCMIFIFGSIPFVDVVIVRYVDDRIRSRVAGFRLAVSLGISALAVWILGPFVKSAGFDSLFMFMALISMCTFAVVLLLPSERTAAAAAADSAVQT
ncbi:MFS transporter [Orrella daihaiensis]|uniref:MFS transporter n=1 Tax=Orrella daihaiensis TaxID=2782176 RepID=A0ABY4AHS0_9BURK|nr:MFS transporter [Orrella daihaiensis]UOD49628.1 MFS transporter [Orrella daihaiensis]